MVGFGSSLRMSRRRGWEDAYLDYQSLRLLLTQIEAVYEEEDWKRGDNHNNNNQSASEEEVVVASSTLPNEHDNRGNIGRRCSGLLHDAWKKTRAIVTGKSSHRRYNNSSSTTNRGRVGSSRTRGSSTSSSSRYPPRNVRNVTNTAWLAVAGIGYEYDDDDDDETTNNRLLLCGGGGGNGNNATTNWAAHEEYNFGYSPEELQQHRSSSSRKRKKDKDGNNNSSHDRALDRGGWRSPGVTDYRDELFLVSDDDFAFGCHDDDDDDDDDDWEDVEDGSIGNEDNDQHYYDGQVAADGHYDIGTAGSNGNNEGYFLSDGRQQGLSSLPSVDDEEAGLSDLIKTLTPGSPDRCDIEDTGADDDDDDDPSEHICPNSPSSGQETKNQEDAASLLLFGPSKDDGGGQLLQTPDSRNSPVNVKPGGGGGGQQGRKVQFSDSPGVLEAGYETFAAAAARRGFVVGPNGNNSGDSSSSHVMTVGSPSEQGGGWLDFIPNLLSRGKLEKKQHKASQQRLMQKQTTTTTTCSETDPLILHGRETSSRDYYPLDHHHRGSSSLLDIISLPPKNSTSYGRNGNNVDVNVANDSPHRYTHFSDAFHTHRSTSEEHGNLTTEEEGDGTSSSSRLAFPLDNETSTMDNNNLASATTIRGFHPPSMPTTSVDIFGRRGSTSLMPMPEIPTTPPATPPLSEKRKGYSGRKDNRIGGFGVSLRMIPTESSELLTGRPSSPRKKTPVASQFYSFQSDSDDCDYHDQCRSGNDGLEDDEDWNKGGGGGGYPGHEQQHTAASGQGGGDYDGDEEEEERTGTSNMISFYSGGKDGYFAVRSPTKMVSARRHHHPSAPHPHSKKENSHQHQYRSSSSPRLVMSTSSSSSVNKSVVGENSGVNFIRSFLFGNARDSAGKKTAIRMSNHQGPGGSSRNNLGTALRSRSNERVGMRSVSRKKRAAAAARRKRARLRKQQQLRHRRERVPHHLRAAHARAAAITERFRGLLRAEVEKVILFANSRLGELSDTIGSLRYSSYEDGQEEMRPSLADGGIHESSSSDDGDSAILSCASSTSQNRMEDRLEDNRGDRRTFKSDPSNDETKKQIILRDRLRCSRPMFQKADFLGEDFSLLSAVDEADAYTAIGVELMHLLKYVCVNIIAVRKICRKHDRLLSNRMLGGYYQRLAAEANKSHSSKKNHDLFQLNENEAHPQFGGTLLSPTTTQSTGYISGIYDTKIQHIANSTTMQTVSSSLAIALADFEASQSRSSLLGLGFGSKSERPEKAEFAQPEVPPPRHQTTSSRIRDAVTYQISGQCFRGDDESTAASEEECGDENASTSSNTPLTRLQFVVTSIFGLREAARFKSVPYEHYASRLFMISTGRNVAGDGLDGCSRESLDVLCSYQPDAAYTLDMETLYNSLKSSSGQEKGIGDVMVACLSSAAKGYDLTSNRARFRRHVASAMSINPQATGEENDAPSYRNTEYQNILRLNANSLVLYLANYYCMVPTAHILSISLGSRSSTAALIGVANISSILSLLAHSIYISKSSSFIRRHTQLADLRVPLILCSLFALAGNILYSCSLGGEGSLVMALIGRFLIGCGSAEILNIQVLSTILSQESVNSEVASLAKKSMVTIAAALVFGSIVDIQVKDRMGFAFQPGYMPPILSDPMLSTMPLPLDPLAPFGQRRRSLFSLESIGYVMAFAWFVHLVGLIFCFDLPKSKRREDERETVYHDELKLRMTQEEDFDSDNEGYDSAKKPPYASTDKNPVFISEEIGHGDGTLQLLQTMSRKTVRHQSQHTYMESITDVRRLMFSNVAYPLTVAILFMAKTTAEILLSSCGTIASRYFNWSGARSGLLMGIMTTSILPINMKLASERNFTERRIMKVALEVARYGLVLMLNYESIFIFIKGIIDGPRIVSSTRYHYDGMFGAPQYICSFAIIFSSIVTLESVTLQLMSKVQASPRHMKKYTIDSAFIVIFVSAVARLLGDFLIFAFDVSSLNDIVNSLCITLIIAFTFGIYVVRKHYFFLI